VHILKFIKTINPVFSSLVHQTLQSVRGFFRYAYKQKLLKIDLASMVPKDNYKKQPKLPSTYSSQEIETMLSTIDRGNSVGKRNHAIVLLAARLGLRASDIANLKFENFLWNQSTIVLNQYKTGKKIGLPILTEVGNAIIDYLKYGRPKSTQPFVFSLARSPYTPIRSCAITGIVHSCFVKSGVNISYRKHRWFQSFSATLL
jgi:integrase